MIPLLVTTAWNSMFVFLNVVTRNYEKFQQFHSAARKPIKLLHRFMFAGFHKMVMHDMPHFSFKDRIQFFIMLSVFNTFVYAGTNTLKWWIRPRDNSILTIVIVFGMSGFLVESINEATVISRGSLPIDLTVQGI